MISVGATSINRMVLPVAAIGVAAGAAALFFINWWPIGHQIPTASRSPVETKGPSTAAADSTTAPVAREGDAALATAQRQASDLTTSLAPSSPLPANSAPEFDIVRIEPNGEAVIAGRAPPGTTVELLRNGEPHDRVVAGQSGEFAMIPRPLPPGTYDLTLRSRQADGKQATSKQSVAVVLEPKSDQAMVALMAPDKPTVVLSRPSAPASVAETTVVEAVDVEPNGRVHVSGRARPGAVVRLYLNDSFVASATAGDDGRLSVTINEGVPPGKYRARLDELASSSGKVRARAEVSFDVPNTITTAGIAGQPATSTSPAAPAAQQPRLAAAGSVVLPDNATPSAVVVPKIATITVSRGDSLWRLSRQALGGGERYALIFKANREQIRNPNLIYPGQIFVLPAKEKRP
jgi:nucleoid-associated protein YgaU